jgi:hypothetical protein
LSSQLRSKGSRKAVSRSRRIVRSPFGGGIGALRYVRTYGWAPEAPEANRALCGPICDNFRAFLSHFSRDLGSRAGTYRTQ